MAAGVDAHLGRFPALVDRGEVDERHALGPGPVDHGLLTGEHVLVVGPLPELVFEGLVHRRRQHKDQLGVVLGGESPQLGQAVRGEVAPHSTDPALANVLGGGRERRVFVEEGPAVEREVHARREAQRVRHARGVDLDVRGRVQAVADPGEMAQRATPHLEDQDLGLELGKQPTRRGELGLEV